MHNLTYCDKDKGFLFARIQLCYRYRWSYNGDALRILSYNDMQTFLKTKKININ